MSLALGGFGEESLVLDRVTHRRISRGLGVGLTPLVLRALTLGNRPGSAT